MILHEGDKMNGGEQNKALCLRRRVMMKLSKWLCYVNGDVVARTLFQLDSRATAPTHQSDCSLFKLTRIKCDVQRRLSDKVSGTFRPT